MKTKFTNRFDDNAEKFADHIKKFFALLSIFTIFAPVS